MFYSPDLLVRKNSNFALIWRYMHDSRRKTKTRGELIDLDVTRACEDLLKYIPSGHLNDKELQTKMSLYLLGQLLYGITLVHQLQVTSFLSDIHLAGKSMLRVPEPEKKMPKKRGIQERNIVEQLEDEEQQKKKKRVSNKQRLPSVLDLNDPSAYVQDRPLRQITTEPFAGIDDNFGEPLGDTRGNQTFVEVEADIRRSAQGEVPMEVDVQLRDPKTSVGWLSFNQSPVGQQQRQPATPNFDVSGLAPPSFKRSEIMPEEIDIEPPQIHQPFSQPQNVPIYRQSDDNKIPDSQLSQDLLFLAPLPPVKAEGPDGKKKRRKHLIIDEQTVISSEEMMQQLNDYSSLIKTHEMLVEEYERSRRPSVADLMNPRPLHWQALSEDLYPLFDAVLKNVREKPLTFDEASKFGFDELRRRRFSFDLHSWNSAEVAHEIAPPFEEQVNTKVSSAEIMLSPLREEPVGGDERRASSIEPARRGTNRTPRSLLEEPIQFEPLELEQTTTAIAPAFVETESVVLYQQIMEQNKRILVFNEVIGPVSKQVAAKKFIALLYLLKREVIDGKWVKVRQDEPYGDIRIKIKDHENPE